MSCLKQYDVTYFIKELFPQIHTATVPIKETRSIYASSSKEACQKMKNVSRKYLAFIAVRPTAKRVYKDSRKQQLAKRVDKE